MRSRDTVHACFVSFRPSVIIAALVVLPASLASAANTLKIYEQTGSINVYTFPLDDVRLFDDTAGLPGPPSLGYGGYDFGTGGCEYYDIFFCDSAGSALEIGPGDPLPPALYLRIECWDISCNDGADVAAPNWVSAGNNVDAVVLDLDGQLLYGREIADAVYGLCDEPFDAKTSNFAGSALGPPDGGITKMGCGWSMITMALDPFVPPPPPPPPEPLITAVEDVGNDGGRQVRLRWDASPLDIAGSPQPVTGYALWRRIDPLPPGMAPLATPDEPVA
ncbi:MAG: hypothetical protein PHQ19_04720, partial [Candidatus Krumholzibacteria bacterium]|nr:hypothetical protein [Candidatus Krumholzibacteria bacterium]